MWLTRRSGERIDMARASQSQMRSLRGADLAMVFQEPMTSLNPVFTVGEQIAESIRLHQGLAQPRGAGRGAAHAGPGAHSGSPQACWAAIRTSCRAACASAW